MNDTETVCISHPNTTYLKIKIEYEVSVTVKYDAGCLLHTVSKKITKRLTKTAHERGIIVLLFNVIPPIPPTNVTIQCVTTIRYCVNVPHFAQN
jgi:hypothetical protein